MVHYHFVENKCCFQIFTFKNCQYELSYKGLESNLKIEINTVLSIKRKKQIYTLKV